MLPGNGCERQGTNINTINSPPSTNCRAPAGPPVPLEPQLSFSPWSGKAQGNVAQQSSTSDLAVSSSRLSSRVQKLPSVHSLLHDSDLAVASTICPPHTISTNPPPATTLPIYAHEKSQQVPEAAASLQETAQFTPHDSLNRAYIPHPQPCSGISATRDEQSSLVSPHLSGEPDSQLRPTFPNPSHQVRRPESQSSSLSSSSDVLPSIRLPSVPNGPEGIGKKTIHKRGDSTLSRAPARMPRCVGQAEVTGEGLCYIYEDGTFCRTVIDGERVNPNWGVTKAGKPRKRLAQACLTCREKKIKCDPAYPKCNQCAKSQRVCKGSIGEHSNFDNASVKSRQSGTSLLKRRPSIDLASTHEQSAVITRSKSSPQASRSQVSVRGLLDDIGPVLAEPKSKRARTPNAVDSYPNRGIPLYQAAFTASTKLPMSFPADPFALNWEHDPYQEDPSLTLHLLELYFTYVNSATYRMFPRGKFMDWVRKCIEKSQDDRMLLYTLLAMGSIFSTDRDHKTIGNRFAKTAAYAIEHRLGKFSLQLVQSRLILGLYHFANGKSTLSWDYCGAALRAVSALNLNSEEGIQTLPGYSEVGYGLSRESLEECGRRTFWASFLMDRYNGFCGGTLFVIQPDDTFLRLPCTEMVFEEVQDMQTPRFCPQFLDHPSPTNPSLGPMAYLALISAIWGEVLSMAGRSVNRTPNAYTQMYESFYAQTNKRLDNWVAQLPAYLQLTPSSLETSRCENYAGTLISLHALYHAAAIRLNRQVRSTYLSQSTVQRNIHCARRHASMLLEIMQCVCQELKKSPTFIFSTPFPGYAFMIACDVLSAGGQISTIPQLISALNDGLTCVNELATFWASAKAQKTTIEKRIKLLAEVAIQEKCVGRKIIRKKPCWRLPSSLETGERTENDVLYATSDELFFDAIEFERE